MKREEAQALFLLAGFNAKAFHELPNGYWPDAYVELRRENPWWLVMTDLGAIKIGWRKRVISISWSDTALRKEITSDDVTKDSALVHAWSVVKALEYLTALRRELQAISQVPAPSRTDGGDGGEVK